MLRHGPWIFTAVPQPNALPDPRTRPCQHLSSRKRARAPSPERQNDLAHGGPLKRQRSSHNLDPRCGQPLAEFPRKKRNMHT
ncbi:hypothetical protein PUNSTDRAFT_122823, partial [Punctularia strigosozonata HHB-11173 SS5]